MSRLWSNSPNLPPPEKAFGGSTYDPKRDYVRLTGQLGRVFDVMRDGEWRTLSGIKLDIWRHFLKYADTEPAISARLRDLRKEAHGGHTVERKSLGGGLFAYRLIVRGEKAA